MKTILGLVAFILTFGFSVSIIGLLFGFPEAVTTKSFQIRTNSSAKHKIRRLLKRDVRNGRSRHSTAGSVLQSGTNFDHLYTNQNYRSTVLKYVRRSSSMSDRGLPRDFQYAWRNHMKAWKKQATHIQEWEIDDRSAHSMKTEDNTREINETWDQVLRIAQRYGLKIDRSYYR